MATYSGALTSTGLPELADDGEIDFPAMTPRRSLHVTIRDEGGNAVLPESANPAPGSAPDFPLYVGSVASIDGTVTTRPEMAKAFSEYALTVSTSAVRLCGVNVNRKAITITNNTAGTLYVGFTSGVTSSGAGMGRAVHTMASYSDAGDGVWLGEMWGVYSAAASVQNVSVADES